MNTLARRASLFALLFYAGLSIFYTRPLLLHITTAVAGGDTDGWQNLWSIWWTPFALFNLHQLPFHTNWIFYQPGVSLYFHTLAPLNGLISTPFQLLGAVFAENIIVLLSYLLTAWFTYLLARLLLRNYIGWQGGEGQPGDNVGARFIAPNSQSVIYHAPTDSDLASNRDGGQGVINHAPTAQGQPSIINQPSTLHSSLLTPHSSLMIELAAFTAGFAFAFANPWRVQYLYGGQVERLSSEWVPLFLYFAYRAYLNTSWRNAVFAALCSIAIMLTDLQSLIYITIFTFVLLLVELLAKGWRRWLQPALRLIGTGALALLLLSPLLYAMLKELGSHPELIPLPSATILHSADLLSLFAPNRSNPLWGGFAAQLNLNVNSNALVVGVFSPPYVVIALAIGGLILGGRWLQSRVLLINLLIFLLLSLGPLLHINGTEVASPFGGSLAMPYALLYQLPFMQVSREPGRFGEMAYLCWALLAALGGFSLAQRTFSAARAGNAEPSPPQGLSGGSRHRRWWVLAGFALLILLLGSEFVTVTPPTPTFAVPPFYQQLASDPAHYAILELPAYKSGDEDRWFSYQTVHQKYLFGGDLARKQPNLFLEDTPVLDWFAARQLPTPDIVPTPPFSAAFDVLRWANVRYVVLIKQPVAEQNLDGEQALLKALWGTNTSPTYSDSIMDAYQVPGANAATGSTLAHGPLLGLGSGWYTFEGDAQGGHRWLSGEEGNHDASISLLNLGTAGNYTLTMRGFSYAQPYQVAASYGGDAPITLTIAPPAQTFTLPLHLNAGRTELTFHLLGEPVSPLTSGQGKDRRLLSVGFGNFVLTR